MNSLHTLWAMLAETPCLAAAVVATFALLALEALLVSRHGRAQARHEREASR
jgi:hypothetical protein